MKRDRMVLKLVFIALYSALFIVLDYAAHTFGIFTMPNGGSLGLGTLAILIAAYHLGWKEGVLVGLISVPLQFMIVQPWFTPTWPWVGFILDYLIPFGIYGIAPWFKDLKLGKVVIKTGVIVTNLIRFGSHVVVGALLWNVTWIGSVVYNGTYMLPTLILGVILVPLILGRLPITNK